jgi:hypothetical protein
MLYETLGLLLPFEVAHSMARAAVWLPLWYFLCGNLFAKRSMAKTHSLNLPPPTQLT